MNGPAWGLFALAGWATVLSLETLFRQPGAGPWPALPDQIERQGRVYRRAPAADDPGDPPPALTLVAAANYQPKGAGGGPPIRLRLLTLASSGTGVEMPVEAIGQDLIGPGSKGRCVVLDANGTIQSEQPTDAAWQAWKAPQRPSPQDIGAWLVGLRPYRANTCLWESLPR
ncbi:hypothetical protein [Synechococcus sp. CS-603]|uniref:hypothetical protein n=1 Tax=Synechococcus sp. CS-603 TaxID=2847981 RepID=UPI00223B3FD6|nr:hypothetical protein [Synechococcus sp. CS-603]MCT0202166.1 hypothetical protein [Synechococcus sp. CS-603]